MDIEHFLQRSPFWYLPDLAEMVTEEIAWKHCPKHSYRMEQDPWSPAERFLQRYGGCIASGARKSVIALPIQRPLKEGEVFCPKMGYSGEV